MNERVVVKNNAAATGEKTTAAAAAAAADRQRPKGGSHFYTISYLYKQQKHKSFRIKKSVCWLSSLNKQKQKWGKKRKKEKNSAVMIAV